MVLRVACDAVFFHSFKGVSAMVATPVVVEFGFGEVGVLEEVGGVF